MIDVIDPSSANKYGDTAEPSDGQSRSPVDGTTRAPDSAGIGLARSPGSPSIIPASSSVSATTLLRARGRGLALELDDDGVIVDEDVEEAEEDVDEEYTGQPYHFHQGSPLKASLLDYVLSEVAMNRSRNGDSENSGGSQNMDLEQGPAPPPRGKYAFNPEEDVPPHLSEYYERNVIAILNRCDPDTWGRCLSCGSGSKPDAAAQIMDNTNEADDKNKTASSNIDTDIFWSYYNYKSDYRTNPNENINSAYHHQQHQGLSGFQNQFEVSSSSVGGGLGGGLVAGGSEPVSPFYGGVPSLPPSCFFMEEARMRCNSDGGNLSNTSSADLDNNLPGGGAGSAGAGTTAMMEDEEVFTFDARLLSEAFLSSGRVDHTIQLMAYHPDYLEIFLRTHHFLMRGDGPLPYNFRNYIAIMAAARYRCSYLMELQKREFLYQGGDPNWLRGLEFAPPKLTALYSINKMMAHRPWVLKKEDLQHLTKKAGWSLSEVVQAVVILAHFHSLSSFIHGCGITPEVDFDNGHTFLLDPSRMGDSPDPNANARHHHHGQVSFAVEHLHHIPPNGASPPSSATKQTKSILKKTDGNLPLGSNANNGNTGGGSGPGINVPNVHFQYHHHHLSAGSSPIPSPGSTPVAASLLKSDTLHNSACGGGSPPRGGVGSVSEVDIIMATMKNLSETSPIEDPEERKKRFETVARSDLDSTDQKENVQRSVQHGTHASMLPPDVSPFIAEPEFTYEDFAKRGQVSELHTFRIQDYSWEEHGFSLVNRLYTEVGQILDDKFKVAQNMTYYTIGGRANVDTTKFRTAVWNYIQCLYGIRHDDYDYGEVNQLLERPLKAFIKTVCCYPERITKADYDNVMREFKHSEKVHVNLMIMEAKLQAELLYALRTVMKLMF